MRFAYADPPYLGSSRKHYGALHAEADVYDTVEGHRLLIDRLVDEFPDGWALSMTSGNLRTLLPLTPADCRVGGWFKPFASFKPNVNPGYCWEPVVFRGGRKFTRQQPTVRDYCAVNIALKKGFPGAKPQGFSDWMMSLFNIQPGDELVDLFPGSGAVSLAWMLS